MNEKKVLKTAIFIAIITLLSKITGLLRESFVANIYGTGEVAQAFLASSKIPMLLFDVVIGGVISATFIPIFNQYLKKDEDSKSKDRAMQFANEYINIIVLITVIIAALGIIFSKQLVQFTLNGSEITQRTKDLANDLTAIMFPMIIFTGIAFSFVGILHSFGQYIIPAIMSLISNLIILAYMFFFGSEDKVYGLAVIMLIAWAVQAIIQIPWVIKSGYRYRFRLSLRSEGIKKATHLAPPMLISTWIQPVCSLLIIRMASNIEAGRAVSAFEYSNRLYLTIVGIFSFVIGNLIFPLLAKAIAENKEKEFKQLSASSIKNVMLIMIPITVGVLILCQPIVRIVFQRGAFTPEDTTLTALALKYSAIGMVFYALNEIFNKVFYSLQDSKTPMITGITSMLVSLVGVIILPRYFGIRGLAIAVPIGSIVNCIINYFMLVKRKGKFMSLKDIVDVVKMFIAVAIMGVSVFIVNQYFGGTKGMCLAVIAGVFIYFAICLFLGVSEVKRGLAMFINISIHPKDSRILSFAWYSALECKIYFYVTKFNSCVRDKWQNSKIVNAICNRNEKPYMANSVFNKVLSKPFDLINSIHKTKFADKLKNSLIIYFCSCIWKALICFAEHIRVLLINSIIFGKLMRYFNIGNNKIENVDFVKLVIMLTVFLTPILPTTLILIMCGISTILFFYRCFTDSRYSIKTDTISILIFAFLLVYGFSVFISYTRMASMYVFIFYLIFIGFYFVLYNIIKNKRDVFNTIIAFLSGALVVSLFGILQYFLGTNTESSWVDSGMFNIKARVYSTLENPNVLGEYLVLLIPIAIFALLFSKITTKNKVISFGVLGAMGLCILLTFSRGAWLGVILAVAVISFFALANYWVLFALFGLTTIMLLPKSITDRFTSIGNTKDTSTSYRIAIWIGTLYMLKDFFLTGIGMGEGSFHMIFPIYSYNAMVAHHSHNLLLQIVTEVGIVGIVIFIAIIGNFVFKMIRVTSKTKNIVKKRLILVLVAGVLGFMLQSLFDYAFYNRRVMLCFWQIIAFTCAVANIDFDVSDFYGDDKKLLDKDGS